MLKLKDSYQASTTFEENVEHFIDDNQLQEATIQNHSRASWSLVKLKRQVNSDTVFIYASYMVEICDNMYQLQILIPTT